LFFIINTTSFLILHYFIETEKTITNVRVKVIEGGGGRFLIFFDIISLTLQSAVSRIMRTILFQPTLYRA
jgi:hypothetical protein